MRSMVYSTWIYRSGILIAAAAAGFSAYMLRLALLLPRPEVGHGPGAGVRYEWPEPSHAPGIDWTIVQSKTGAAGIQPTDLAKRFRLAGTFFEFVEQAEPNRRAILDDIKSGIQHVVSEGDRLEEVTVVSIFKDRVVIRDLHGEAELWLSFSGRAGTETLTGDGVSGGGAADAGSVALGRFGGRRMGPNRWTFDRDALLKYYQELRDEPERLVRVFDSLKPVRDDVHAITGYRLGVEGEPDLFEAAGIREGDVVRSVNSVPMTNRRRAEFLLGQFVNGNASAFVFEIERDGRAEKLVYEIR